MLSKKDLENIRGIIQEELKEAFVRKVVIERGPRKPGDLEKHSAEEEWSFVDFWFGYAPKIEAALRGMQEDTNKCNNKTLKLNEGVEAMAQILMANEGSIKKLAIAAQQLNYKPQLIEAEIYESDN